MAHKICKRPIKQPGTNLITLTDISRRTNTDRTKPRHRLTLCILVHTANLFNLMKCSCNSRHLHSQGNEPFGRTCCGSKLPSAGHETPASKFEEPNTFICSKKDVLKTRSVCWQGSLHMKCYISSRCCSEKIRVCILSFLNRLHGYMLQLVKYVRCECRVCKLPIPLYECSFFV